MGRRERAVGPLEASGAVNFISIPFSGVSSAVLARELPVALPVALEPLARVLRPVTIPILADAVPLPIDDLTLKHLPPGFRAIIIIMARRRIGDLEVAVDA